VAHTDESDETASDLADGVVADANGGVGDALEEGANGDAREGASPRCPW
jgi:hypothetical protein